MNLLKAATTFSCYSELGINRFVCPLQTGSPYIQESGHTMMISNNNCEYKTQIQTLCMKKLQETWRMHAPFSGQAALAVENTGVNILQQNVEGIT